MLSDFRFGKVVIIGDLILDCYVTGSVDRVSPEAPVPVLLRAHQTVVPGGAANVAMNAATLGCSVELVGLVGMDHSAEKLAEALSGTGRISTAGLVVDPCWTTITKTRVLSGRQQIVRIDEEQVVPLSPGTEAALVAALELAIATADVVVCSDYAKGVLSDAVLDATMACARARGIPVVVDPKRRDLSAYGGAFLVTPNRKELAACTGKFFQDEAGLVEAARYAAGQVGGHVLVTRSEEGMSLVRQDGSVLHVPVRRSEVFDVSGAGDTVVATIASVLSAGHDLETAITISACAASIVVNKLGTATVSRAELSAALLNDMCEDGATVTINQARHTIEAWHHRGARVVFTNGCFDLLHPGHIALIRAAARQGDRLIVAINSDASVRRLKGEARPVQDEQARATVIGALRDVDMVVIFDEDTPLETIRALQPDILVKGADYREDQVIGGDLVKLWGGRVVLVDLVAGRSTSSIVRKMRDHTARS